ncbi:MAG: HEAT repeat domain-containing protein [Terriglobia bacterium]
MFELKGSKITRYVDVLGTLLFGGFVAVAAWASLVPNLDLQALVDDSGAVVVGQVVAVTAQGRTVAGTQSVSGTLMQADLRVEKTLKGRPGRQRLTFQFFFPDAPMAYRRIPKGQFGVFFLRKSAGGYEVANSYYPFVVACPASPPAEGSIPEQVVAEVAYVLRCANASSESRQAAVYTLRAVRTAASTAALKVAARDPNMRVRCSALATMLRRNDISLLPEAQAILLHPPPSADPNCVDSIAYGIRDGVRDARAIRLLEPLLHASNVRARRAAAAALRATGDPSAIGPLTEALWDTDLDVRYYAVVGLGEITGQNEWTPAVDYFAQNEQKFLTHWREWAKSHR